MMMGEPVTCPYQSLQQSDINTHTHTTHYTYTTFINPAHWLSWPTKVNYWDIDQNTSHKIIIIIISIIKDTYKAQVHQICKCAK